MSELYDALLKKERELKSIIRKASKALQNVPEGKLRITHQGNRTQYYYRSPNTDGKHKTGKYHMERQAFILPRPARAATGELQYWKKDGIWT